MGSASVQHRRRSVVHLPGLIDFERAAGMMLQGMTAEYLKRTYPVRQGQTVLFHATAAGVGPIFCQ